MMNNNRTRATQANLTLAQQVINRFDNWLTNPTCNDGPPAFITKEMKAIEFMLIHRYIRTKITDGMGNLIKRYGVIYGCSSDKSWGEYQYKIIDRESKKIKGKSLTFHIACNRTIQNYIKNNPDVLR